MALPAAELVGILVQDVRWQPYQAQGIHHTVDELLALRAQMDLALLTANCVVDIDAKLELLVDLVKQEVQDPESSSESPRYLFYYLYGRFVERHRIRSPEPSGLLSATLSVWLLANHLIGQKGSLKINRFSAEHYKTGKPLLEPAVV